MKFLRNIPHRTYELFIAYSSVTPFWSVPNMSESIVAVAVERLKLLVHQLIARATFDLNN